MKNAGALSWSEVDSREAALIRRCTAGDEVACAELVAEHQRMVFTLALHLLGDRDEALDLSQEVFLRVFRTLASFRGQSALRTWIYRIVINQARNRQRWWRTASSREPGVARRARAAVRRASNPPTTVLPDRALASKETAERIWRALDRSALRSAHGAGPARDRRPALRRDCVFTRRGGGHGEVATDARTPGAAGGVAGIADMTQYVGCDHARTLLEGLIDGELSMADQLAVESHLRWCDTCALRVEDMRTIGDSLRAQSDSGPAMDATDDSLTALNGGVLIRVRAERASRSRSRMGEMFSGSPAALAGAWRDERGAPVRRGRRSASCRPRCSRTPESLAAMISAIGSPGTH